MVTSCAQLTTSQPNSPSSHYCSNQLPSAGILLRSADSSGHPSALTHGQPGSARKSGPREEDFHQWRTRSNGLNSPPPIPQVNISKVVLHGFSEGPGRMKLSSPQGETNSRPHPWVKRLSLFLVSGFLTYHSCSLGLVPKLSYRTQALVSCYVLLVGHRLRNKWSWKAELQDGISELNPSKNTLR